MKISTAVIYQIHPLLLLISSSGIVQVGQRNSTLVEMEIFDDGPYEVVKELSFLPANSYLGELFTNKVDLSESLSLNLHFSCASLL